MSEASRGPSQGRESGRSQPVWAQRLAEPRVVLVAIPGLVLLIGVVLTLSSFRGMQRLAHDNAVAYANAEARRAEENIQRTLVQADLLLDRAGELARNVTSNADPVPLAHALRDLALSRKGLKWMSVSFPDGTFEGVFVDRDGKLRFQRSQIERGQTRMVQMSFVGGRLEPFANSALPYDPRERAFYGAAVARKQRVWTEPYPFFPDFRTGITRAEALFGPGQRLHAVVTVDYDITELSGLLGGESDLRAPTVLFSPEGAILALAPMNAEVLPRKVPTDRPLRFQDLTHPPLRAFFERRSATEGPKNLDLRVAGEDYVVVEHVLSTGSELRVRFAMLFPRERLLAAARQQSRAAILLSCVIVLAGVFLALVLARTLHRLRFARARAEEREQVALARARELGSYQLEGLLGSGGMGEVWRARHRLLARPAAIKLIRTDLVGVDRERLETRFEREAKILSQLRSTHTISVLDFGRTTDGRLFLVMELLEGLALDELVERHGPQPAARVIPLLIGICESLAEAHESGLVHRDIKPANVFLSRQGEDRESVKVLDFGLAKFARGPGLTAEGGTAGTPDYMAPEQARGLEIDGRADLYALGCTAWFLLVGQPLFPELNAVSAILAHQLNTPPALDEVATQWIPVALQRLIHRCLSKDPAFRPGSAASLGRALRAIEVPEAQAFSEAAVRAWWDGLSAAREVRRGTSGASATFPQFVEVSPAMERPRAAAAPLAQ